MGWLTDGEYNPQYRKAFSIKAAQVSGTPSDFPLVLHIASDSDLASHARSDGYDIAVTLADGTTELSYERVLWDSGTGELLIWFKDASPESGDDYYLYYGDADQDTDRQDATDVWSNDYGMVHHMAGAAYTDLDDSTACNRDITTEGGDPSYNQIGQVGKAVEFDGDDYIATAVNPFANADLSGGATLAVWLKTTETDYSQIVSDEGWFDIGMSYSGYENRAYGTADGGAHIYYSDGNVNDGTWHYLVLVYSSGNAYLYVDGDLDDSGASSAPNVDGTSRPLAIAAHGVIQDYLAGVIDEASISVAARSADWIATCYNNQVSPSPGGTFWSALGSEETGVPQGYGFIM